MGVDRREFIRIIGLSTAMGMVSVGPFKAFARDVVIPEELPLTAGRWAMVIDAEKCMKEEGCRDCINACNYYHNVPDFENNKHEIKWIWKEPFEHVFEEQAQEYVPEELKQSDTLILCNHCDNPPCVRVCPTQATFKRDDGIVMMDQHRCIGCRYCMAACPYGSRSFNWKDPRPHIKEEYPDYPTRTKGVVEKCTFCDERLAKGLMPACVEACKYGALVFGDLGDPKSDVRKLLDEHYTIRRKPELGTKPQIYYLM